VVVGGVAGVDAVGAVDQSVGMLTTLGRSIGWRTGALEVVEFPVVAFSDVEDSSLFVWEGLV
jgi:hypothetical protein